MLIPVWLTGHDDGGDAGQSQRGDNVLQVTLAAVARGHDTATAVEPNKRAT
jgi:hypothetical protein